MHIVLGTIYVQNWVSFGDQSTLLQDATLGSERQRELLQVDTRHGLHLLEGGLVIDTRDDEIALAWGIPPDRGPGQPVEDPGPALPLPAASAAWPACTCR